MAAAKVESVSFETEDIAIPFSLQQDAWASYKRHRPEYPQSTFDMIYEYHRSHGGKFDAVHDVGAGGGVLSETLAKSFSHVYVSDPGESNLALARTALTPPSRFTFRLAPGEATWLPPSSIDMAAFGESFHWVDTQPGFAAAAASLRPGGTFAAIFYGVVMDFPQDTRLTTLLRETEVEAFRRFFAPDPRFQHPSLVAAPRRCRIGWDCIALPTDEWRDWTRVTINLNGRSVEDAFQGLPNELFPVPDSQVKQGEKIMDMSDPTWGREVDVDWVKGFLVSLTMPYDQRCWDLPSFVEFERIINDEYGGKVQAEWPVSIIMGSRK